MSKAYAKLMAIQQELKAPKNQKNTFGGYNYRSCEDILEALKPLLSKNNATITISDSLEMLGHRYYVKATAKLICVESGEYAESTAYAREAEDRKGMDTSQVTGSTSSYARKYALNGLFAIDDVKDADSTNTHDKEGKQPAKISDAQASRLFAIAKANGITNDMIKQDLEHIGVAKTLDLTKEQYDKLIKKYEGAKA